MLGRSLIVGVGTPLRALAPRVAGALAIVLLALGAAVRPASASALTVPSSDPGVPQPMSALPAVSAAQVQLAPTPPMGWDPWYEFECKATEQLAEQSAQAIVSSGMAADGYRYINLDDCWMAPERAANGDLQADPTTYPQGIAALASYVHGLGLKLGIYLDAGTKTCMERPGSEFHFAQDVDTVAAWGIDYIKVDYCYINLNLTVPQSIYTEVEQAIAAVGRPIVLSVSDDGIGDPWLWAPGLASLWRTTNDYTAYGAQYGHWWQAVLKIASINSRLHRYAQPGAWNDPDNLLVGTGLLTVPQERSQFSLWSVMAAPLIVDGDVRKMSRATAAILTNRAVIAVDQDPAGLQGVRIADHGGHQVWIRKLADGSHAVLFLDTDSRAATIAVSATRIGLAHRRYAVQDLWRHRSWTSSAAVIRARVGPDDVVMLRLRPVAGRA